MKKLLASTILAAGLYGFAGSAQAAECGEVSIAEMNWASAGVAAHVDKLILENGYGCTVTLVTGDTMPTFTSMNEKGEPDVAPEMWVNAVRTPLDAAIAVVVTWQSLGKRGVGVVDGGNGGFIFEDFDERVVDKQITSIGSVAGQIRL